MADRKNIDEKIRESFESTQKKAPAGVWSGVSGKLDEESSQALNSRIKDSFESMHSEAPDHVWKSINHQLNIDRGWKGVKRFLDQRTFFRKIRRAAALLLLLLLLGWGGYSYFTEDPSFLAEHLIKKNKKAKEGVAAPAKNQEKHKVIEADRSELDSRGAKSSGPTLSGTAEDDLKDKKEKIVAGSQQIGNKAPVKPGKVKEKIPPTPFSVRETPSNGLIDANALPLMASKFPLLVVNEQPDSLYYEQQNREMPEIESNQDSKGWEIGAFYTYGKTEVVNNELRRSRDQNSLIASETQLTGGYGVSANYNFNPKHSLSGMAYLYQHVQQHYKTYQEGRYINKSLQLRYSKVALDYTFIFERNSIIPSTVHFIQGGAYLSFLQKGNLILDSHSTIPLEGYKNTDFGIRLAIGQEKALRQRWKIRYGVIGEKGLQNIFAGTEKEPSDFNVTSLRGVNVFLMVNYKL